MAHEIKAELQSIWQVPNDWQLIPMGKGYFTLKFGSMEDKKMAKKVSTQDINGGLLRLREWVPKFNPYKEASSLVQVWVRIYYLPIELWHPEVISTIGRYLGSPLKIDASSAVGEVGHYARVIIEIDMSLPLREYVMIDEDDSSLYVEFSYENLPAYCNRCKITGHSTDKCRRTKASLENVNNKGGGVNGSNLNNIQQEVRKESVNEKEGRSDNSNMDSLGGNNNMQQQVIQQKDNMLPQTTSTAWQPKVVIDMQSRDMTDELEVGETEETSAKSIEPFQADQSGVSGPDILERILVEAEDPDTEAPASERFGIDNTEPLNAGNDPVLNPATEMKEGGSSSLGYNGEKLQEKDLKALALENAMKIQRLESLIKDIPQENNQAAAKRGRGRPPGNGRGGRRAEYKHSGCGFHQK
ncbi:uncharacterized protein LOC131008184 [Salvia miltiorrhiza]|uniref:uncharacterized protein LOC131008184 n=1 Tax=Salvia miltiorrhiza TaxID=226208 RepID=UPI0025AC9908|nr:uncharacterized protein LOC131008184 [Salvia miltiorrhiza]